MECWSRALWALVPMLMGKCPEAEALWPLWQEGMIRGTDPSDEEYWGEKGTSAIFALEGYTGGEVIHTETNTNLMEPRCVLPMLHGRLEAGEHMLLCAVFADAGNRRPEEIPEEVRKLAAEL